jgi:hypothetical protein
LSYEAVFLYLYWRDAVGNGAPALAKQRCCRLKPLETPESQPDFEVGRFCGALSMLLAKTKVEDDVRDGISLRMRMARAVLGDRIMESHSYFVGLDSAFHQKIDACMEEHLNLERSGKSVPIQEYVIPTAHAFGYVFGLLDTLSGMGMERTTLTALGSHIGAALIAFDCAADWTRDRARREFNPLPDEIAVHSAMQFSKRELLKAADVCTLRFGAIAQSTQLLLEVSKSLEIAPVPTGSSGVSLLRPFRTLASLGGALGVALAADSDNKDSGAGACCCMAICCLIAAGWLRGKVIGTSSVETDCCGRKRVVHREKTCCDDCR